MFDDIDSKMIKPEKIIDAINELDLKDMIKLYNYKTFLQYYTMNQCISSRLGKLSCKLLS